MDLVVMSGEFVRQRKSPDPVVTAGGKSQEFTLRTSLLAKATKGNNCLEPLPVW